MGDQMQALLLLFLLFSSWLAYVIFEDTEQGKTIFTSYGTTLYQMFILYTTSNNPDVWIPAYKYIVSRLQSFICYSLTFLAIHEPFCLASILNQMITQSTVSIFLFYLILFHFFSRFTHILVLFSFCRASRWYSLFFVLYVLLGVYFVTNLILAVVYDSFKNEVHLSVLSYWLWLCDSSYFIWKAFKYKELRIIWNVYVTRVHENYNKLIARLENLTCRWASQT